MSLVSNELDYKKYVSSHPSYTMSKVLPQNGIQTVTMTTAGGEETIFELPPKVYNLSKSILSFTLTPAIGVPAVAETVLNKIFADTIGAIRQIQLYTRTGLFLVDLNYANNYTNAVSRHETPIDEVLQNDKPLNGYGFWEGLSCSNYAGRQNAAEGIIRPAAGAGDNGTAGAGLTDYLEPKYVVVGTDASANPVINYKVPLKFFKNTGLEVDKDLYFGGETLYLKIIWDNRNKVGYHTEFGDNDNTTHLPINGVTISTISLFTAIEQNPIVESEVKQKVMSAEGLSLQWPMVYYNSTPLAAGAGALHSVQVRYNRGNGSKLKKIYWVPSHQTATTWQAYDHNNEGARKITSFYTTVNNIRTSQFDYNVTNAEDWMVKKESLKGSCIMSSNEYYYNNTWIENFTDDSSALIKSNLPDQHNIDDGLDLNTEVIYTINAINNNVALNHQFFAVTSKDLIIGSAGIQLI